MARRSVEVWDLLMVFLGESICLGTVVKQYDRSIICYDCQKLPPILVIATTEFNPKYDGRTYYIWNLDSKRLALVAWSISS